jgi:hypothetical protein
MSLQLSSADLLLQRLDVAGLDYSVTKSEIMDWLNNSYSKYIQFGEGLLTLLEGRHLRQPVYIDVAFGEYEQAGGQVQLEAPTGALDSAKAKKALLRAYNERYGTSESTLDTVLTF